ncbi:RNA polymerase subunit sigma-54 [Dubosiella newyorkensis]|jgi:RNA polymerase sigma-54 factor|uniref:RNA polymerase factor sigma-54 n=1 Tax=Dubosiella newyorkensis TaxID=1862672 RepID=UPI002356B1B6|nr:RNA polymerase subunit sigma-54 [Dubosiella newyorkensis]MCI9041808.1 RNA polymerase subunit sigma-54 [Dubosiella newyorkensis]
MHQKMIQKQTQTQQLSLSQQRSLEVLRMSEAQLQDAIKELCEQNPFIEYHQSKDLNEWIEEGFVAPVSWKEDLYRQLNTNEETFDPTICSFIIETLNEKGMFMDSEEESIAYLNCSEDRWKGSLKQVQSLDPAGIAARNQSECIILQLDRKKETFASHLLKKYGQGKELLSWKEIARREGATLKEIEEALDKIRACSLYPNLQEATEKEEILIPDFTIHVEGADVYIEPIQQGQLQILNIPKENKNLKSYFQEAHFFMDAMNKRNRTLLILANEIISIQKNHFLFHDELEPCTLQDIAQKSGFHESTVSRTLSNKYYQFEGNIYPIKGLFVSKTKGGTSQDSILKAIQTLIEQEDPHKPFSDQQLCDQLEELGLYVSRRAINKYRKILGIESASKRRK